MKKFILFSLLGCIFFSNVCVADEDPCFSINPGGSMETGLCNGKKKGDPCVPSHATRGICIAKQSGGLACAAIECQPGYLLWVSKKRGSPDIGLSEDPDNKFLGSMGICYLRSWLEGKCTDNCVNCDDVDGMEKRCLLKEVSVRNRGKDVAAFIGEEACKCSYTGLPSHSRPQTCNEKYPAGVDDYEQKRACCELGKEWDEVNNTCICGNDEEWDRTTKRCVKKIVTPVDDCAQYSSNPEAYACCKKGLTWDAANKTCMCPEGYIWDKDKKDCVEIKEEPCNGVDCRKYYLDINLICPDGTRVYGHQYYKIDKNYLKEHGYDSFAEYEAANPVPCQDRIDHDVCMQELFCKGHEKPAASAPSGNLNTSNVPQQQSVVNKPDDKAAAVTRAKKVLDDFYTYAKDDENRSVWKDSEGNFNTIRLASDLTAGVVLGTVGGVVSGVVIKKKQVEKGFDALHCTVGGQTVADWGDTFNVGLR